VLPLVLSPALLDALAQRSAQVSLWHHCPRSQAVAAALAQGQPSGKLMAGQQQVLLGAGSVPLAPLLLRPQVGAGVVCEPSSLFRHWLIPVCDQYGAPAPCC
jgi:hypothetical protein